MTTYAETLKAFSQLRPGDTIEVDHEVKVGLECWHTKTVGTVIRTQRRRHGLHQDRNRDDKVFSDVIVLRREDGELTTVTLDEFSVLTRLDPANGAAEDDQAGRA